MHYNLIPESRTFSFKIENQNLNIIIEDNNYPIFSNIINLNEHPNVKIEKENTENKTYIVIKTDLDNTYIEFIDIKELNEFIENINYLIENKTNTYKHTLNIMDIKLNNGKLLGISGGINMEK